MNIIFHPRHRNQAGYALIVTLTFLGIMLMAFAAMMYYSVSNARVTGRNNQYNASEAAAEAATECVLSQMTHDFENYSLSNSGSYYGTSFLPVSYETNWPIQYAYSNPSNGLSGQICVWLGPSATVSVPLDSQFSGLYGSEQDCTIAATATPNTSPAVPATVTETLQFASIPLFQFAIFYNLNLEIAAASTLTIEGPVWSNAGLWSGSTTITFSSMVSAVGIATNTADDPFCAGYSGSGRSKYSMAGQPTSHNDTITMPVGTNNNPASVEAIVNIPPPAFAMNTSAAFTTNGQAYLANEADLFLTNYPGGTNDGWSATQQVGAPMALYYQDNANSPNYLTWCTNDFYLVSNSITREVFPTNYVPIYSPCYANGFGAANGFQFTNGITSLRYTNTSGPYMGTNYVLYMGYSFLTNVLFYDWREGWNKGSGPPKTVYAVQLDVGAFNVWMTNGGNADPNGGNIYNSECSLNNHKSHPLNSIYLFNAVQPTQTILPAVRLADCGMMPDNSGKFAVATAMPIYVWGDYNASNNYGSSVSQNSTTYTDPAALYGDSITVLSDGWSDANSADSDKSTDTRGGYSAKQTTINAACLEGIVESNPKNPASESSSGGYSGGVENFLRLLENWNNVNLWYNGSIVVMFPSQYATNCWQQTGYYYGAASRKWAFDTNFLTQAGLPPLTPESHGVIRGNWTAQ